MNSTLLMYKPILRFSFMKAADLSIRDGKFERSPNKCRVISQEKFTFPYTIHTLQEKNTCTYGLITCSALVPKSLKILLLKIQLIQNGGFENL